MTGSSYEPSQNVILSEARRRRAKSKDLGGNSYSLIRSSASLFLWRLLLCNLPLLIVAHIH